jgi:hypothetical protein
VGGLSGVMSHVAAQPCGYLDRSHGNGHCVALVRHAGQLPATSAWRRGRAVHDGRHDYGTAIATFNADGRYGNHSDGRSHAALYLSHHEDGSLLVLDQWSGQPAHIRTIRNRRGEGRACDDASRYYVIEAV